MPADQHVQRALARSPFAVVFIALAVLAAPLTSLAQTGDTGLPVGAVLDGPVFLPAPAVVPDAEPTAAQVLDEVADAKPETAMGEALVANESAAPPVLDPPASLLQTALLVLAGLCLLAFAGTVLTLAVREMRKEQQQRRRTLRRRVKRRGTPGETVATAT